jgi:hypothetical protein
MKQKDQCRICDLAEKVDKSLFEHRDHRSRMGAEMGTQAAGYQSRMTDPRRP